MLKAKGPLFKGTLKYIKERFGEEKLKEVKEKLPEEVKNFLQKPILDSSFYPASYLESINEAIISSTEPGADKIYKEIGRFSADAGYHGIYKLLFAVASTKFMVGRAPQVWKTYYSQGILKMEIKEGNNAQILLFDSGIRHRSLCLRIEGFMERVVELTGGKNPKTTHLKCFEKGNDVEEWLLSWE